MAELASISIVAYLVIAGGALSWYGRDAWALGWYSDRAMYGLVGNLGLVVGLFGVACLLWPDAIRQMLIGY